MSHILPATAITAGVGAVTVPMELNGTPRNLAIQANFTYGSGGASVTVWLQTSLDGGVTWCDVAAFGFTTASSRVGVNVTTNTPQGTPGAPATLPDKTTPVTLTDGTMTANTAQDGLLGPFLRVKYLSTGTYFGTTLAIDVQSADLPAYP